MLIQKALTSGTYTVAPVVIGIFHIKVLMIAFRFIKGSAFKMSVTIGFLNMPLSSSCFLRLQRFVFVHHYGNISPPDMNFRGLQLAACISRVDLRQNSSTSFSYG